MRLPTSFCSLWKTVCLGPEANEGEVDGSAAACANNDCDPNASCSADEENPAGFACVCPPHLVDMAPSLAGRLCVPRPQPPSSPSPHK